MLVGRVRCSRALVLGHPETLLSQARERSIYVTMVDQSGAPVPDLGPADFIVREDNLAREVLRVAPATDPMQIAILVDNSRPPAPAVPHMRRALPAFLDVLMAPTASGQRNQVAIITLAEPAHDPRQLLDRTRAARQGDRSRLGGIVRPGATTSSNGIIEVTQGFRKRESARPVIVAITGEGPELSNRHPDQVLTPLRDSGVALHVISIGLPAVGISDDVTVSQHGGGPGDAHERRHARAVADRHRPCQAGCSSLANVLTHAYKVTYGHPDSLIPPRARHRDGQTGRPHGARHSHQRFTGTTVIRSRLRYTLIAAIAAAAVMLGTGRHRSQARHRKAVHLRPASRRPRSAPASTWCR